MLAESFISFQREMIARELFEQVLALILKHYPMVSFNDEMITSICEICANDKKNASNKINCTLLKGIGEGVIDQVVSEQEIVSALQFINNCSK